MDGRLRGARVTASSNGSPIAVVEDHERVG
jgi:hypothetical protein